MYRKNVAGQHFCIAGINATTGAALSGVTWTMRRCLDGTFAAGEATITEDGTTGWYKVALTQADTNGNNCGYFFTGTNAVPVCLNFPMTAGDPTDSVRFGLTALPNAAAGANTGLPVVGTQVPNATAGASNGLLISGSNSGTTTLAALTVTGSLTVSDGLLISRSSANSTALVVTGSGTGNGATFSSGSGATGVGFAAVCLATNGDALGLTGSGTGHGINTVGGATSGHGMRSVGNGTGSGAIFSSGTGATGDGVLMQALSTNGNGMRLIKTGSGNALAAPTTDLVLAKTTNITGFNDIAATAIVSAGAITTSGGAVSTVTSVTNAVSVDAASVRSAVGLAAANLDTQLSTIDTVVDLILDDTGTSGVIVVTNNDKSGYALSATGSAALTEDYAADAVAPTLNQMLYQIWSLAAEKSISGTTLTAKKLDGATTAMTFTLDDATTPTSITRTT